jgi:hypothetical protein
MTFIQYILYTLLNTLVDTLVKGNYLVIKEMLGDFIWSCGLTSKYQK